MLWEYCSCLVVVMWLAWRGLNDGADVTFNTRAFFEKRLLYRPQLDPTAGWAQATPKYVWMPESIHTVYREPQGSDVVSSKVVNVLSGLSINPMCMVRAWLKLRDKADFLNVTASPGADQISISVATLH